MMCDHVDHSESAPVPATVKAHVRFVAVPPADRFLCQQHAQEFRDLLMRGATAWGAIDGADFTSL